MKFTNITKITKNAKWRIPHNNTIISFPSRHLHHEWKHFKAPTWRSLACFYRPAFQYFLACKEPQYHYEGSIFCLNYFLVRVAHCIFFIVVCSVNVWFLVVQRLGFLLNRFLFFRFCFSKRVNYWASWKDET